MQEIRATCGDSKSPSRHNFWVCKKEEFQAFRKICSSITIQNMDEKSREEKMDSLLKVLKVFDHRDFSTLLKFFNFVQLFRFVQFLILHFFIHEHRFCFSPLFYILSNFQFCPIYNFARFVNFDNIVSRTVD